MKKILLSLAALVILLPTASANSEGDAPMTVYSTENGVFSLDLLSHIGMGAHLYNAENFTPNNFSSFEAFFNLVKLKLYPVPVVGIEAGADVEFNWFSSQDNYFYTDSERNLKVGKLLDIAGEGSSKHKSSVDFFGMNFPVMLKLHFGDFRLGAGAQAMLNFTGGTDFRYRKGNMLNETSYKDAKVNLFSYAIIAQISYAHIGLYYKYYPSQPVFFPATDGAPAIKNLMTVGIAVGF